MNNEISRLHEAIGEAEAVVVGAGAGLSTAAGFTYAGERLERYFGDFVARYGFPDMYSGGFYPFPTLEEQWAYWSRYIWINRYAPTPKGTYAKLLRLLESKDFFVITTNVDHQFQLAGFPKDRLFYTQGDYGLWQCSKPCHRKTYDNKDIVRQMVEAQGFAIGQEGMLELPENGQVSMTVPSELAPRCPVCGKPMVMNLRADETFVEDEGWHAAARRYSAFLGEHQEGKVLYLELGVGGNTPVIVKYPFWQMTYANPHATYACLNYGEAFTAREIAKRSIVIDGDIDAVLDGILEVHHD